MLQRSQHSFQANIVMDEWQERWWFECDCLVVELLVYVNDMRGKRRW